MTAPIRKNETKSRRKAAFYGCGMYAREGLTLRKEARYSVSYVTIYEWGKDRCAP